MILYYNQIMKFIKESLSYIKRALLRAVIFAALPAVVLGYFLKPVNLFGFLPLYYKGRVDGFFDIIKMFFVESGIKTLFVFLLLFVLLLIYFSISLGMIEKHLRTGKLSTRRLIADLNNNIISTMISFVLFAAVYIVILLLLSVVMTLMHKIVSDGPIPNVMDCIYATILSFLALGLFTRGVMGILFWGPVMQIYGYSFTDSIIETSHIINGKSFPIFLGIFLPIFFASLIQILLFYIPFSGTAETVINQVINSIVFLGLLIYIPSFIMNTLFEVTDLERRDKNKIY